VAIALACHSTKGRLSVLGAAIFSLPFAAAGEGKLRLIDIRTPQEWRQTGVAPGAGRVELAELLHAEDPARARALRIFDATCPLVTKVHIEVARHARQGRDVVLIGHAGHVEVEGTMGQWPDGPLGGLALSIVLSVGGIFGAFWLGLAAGLMRLSRRWWVRIPAVVYIEVVRGVPLLMLIFWF